MDQDQRNVPDRGVEEFLASHDYSDSTKDNYQRIFGRILTDRDETLTAAGLVKRIKSQKGWGNSQQCVAVNACRKFLRWRYGTSHPALGARIKVEDSKPPSCPKKRWNC
jgi:hypothetical protein